MVRYKKRLVKDHIQRQEWVCETERAESILQTGVRVSAAVIGLVGSLIVATFSLVGVIYSVNKSNDKLNQQIQSEMNIRQAVTDEKITELTREVREHNNFARRMPVVEEQIKVINHRIQDLEDAK